MPREGGWAVLELPEFFLNSVYVTWFSPTFHDLNVFSSLKKKLFSLEKVFIPFMQFC